MKFSIMSITLALVAGQQVMANNFAHFFTGQSLPLAPHFASSTDQQRMILRARPATTSMILAVSDTITRNKALPMRKAEWQGILSRQGVLSCPRIATAIARIMVLPLLPMKVSLSSFSFFFVATLMLP
jgi:hypothetical protein